MSEGDVSERVRNLLQQAVDCLGNQSPPSSSSSTRSNTEFSFTTGRSSLRLFNPRAGPSRERERNSLFNFRGCSSSKSKRPRKSISRIWSHDFVCLADTNMISVPSAAERSKLLAAGLGKKSLDLVENGTCDNLHDSIISAFPALTLAGGYELLRIDENNRRVLEIIPSPPYGYIAEFLKECVHHAKIYIRPVQRSLSEEIIKPTDKSKQRTEKCFTCNDMIPVSELRCHIETCQRKEDHSDISDSEASDIELPKVYIPRCQPSILSSDDTHDTEDALLQHALSLSEANMPTSLSSIITKMKEQLKPEYIEVHVRREHVIEDLLREARRSTFDPLKQIKTWFVGEEGVDTGGITRELWHLLGENVKNWCGGTPNQLVFTRSPARVVRGDIRLIGILVGMSLTQGGSGIPYLAPSVFDYLCGKDYNDIHCTLEEIPDASLKKTLDQMVDLKDDDSLQQFIQSQDVCDAIFDAGWTCPLSNLSKSDLQHLVEVIAFNTVILNIKAELDEFARGLDITKVLPQIRSNSELFRPLFVRTKDVSLTAELILRLFTTKNFSSKGSSAFVREQSTYLFFRDILDEIESGGTGCSLEKVLVFLTGSGIIPPLGFSDITLNYNHMNPFPTASTFGLTLTLPTKYADYTDFKLSFLYAMNNHGGFGLS